MKNIKIIKPYNKRPQSTTTLGGSLYKEGLSRAPATALMVQPLVDAKGTVRTGLDENAIAIRSILDPKVKALEIARVKSLREDIEAKINEDISPEGGFWRDKIEEFFHLKDGDNVFDLNDPYDAIDYYWITQLPIVAKSMDDIKSGKIIDDSIIKFYIFESDVEVENEFNRKKKINDVVATLNKLTEIGIRKVAYLLNLKMSSKATYKDIYNELDTFIKTPKAYGSEDPVAGFITITDYTDEVMNIKVLIRQLLEERVLKNRGLAIFEGENLVAKSIEDFEIKLAEDEELYFGYDSKVKSKKEYVNNI